MSFHRSQYPTDYIEPWCLTHWPGANCFVTHYCASANQKKKLLEIFSLLGPNYTDARYDANVPLVSIDQ
jgi:hypothetical protein